MMVHAVVMHIVGARPAPNMVLLRLDLLAEMVVHLRHSTRVLAQCTMVHDIGATALELLYESAVLLIVNLYKACANFTCHH